MAYSPFIYAALFAMATAVPTGQRSTCSLECTEATARYETGKSYVYQYDLRTSTALLTTLNDHADVHITTTAHIDVVSPCEYTLRLTEVQLEGSTKTQEFAEAVAKSPLRFSFQDGRVGAVCSEVSEPAWVLNFKRGVLSTFQSTVTHPGHQDVQETDISGTCTTHYDNVMEGSVMTINKVKDLSSCTQRPDLSAYIASTAYVSDSPVQSLPIFKSTNNCHQTIEQGILKTAECHESHKFRPFSSEEGGAITTVKTTMVLVSQDMATVSTPNSDFIRKSPVFEETTAASPQTQIEAVNQLLVDLDQAAHGEIRPSVPALFSKLVASLKAFDYDTLATLYTNTRETHSRKFLVDAMPLVGTAAAVGVVKDMFINRDITQAEADTWFTSLAFFKNPTSDMFTAIAPLLETPSKQAMLGTSALVDTYCKHHPHCDTDTGVQQVLRAIEAQLGSSCGTINEEDKMKVLVALKALGNAGRWVNANAVLRRCYTEEIDIEVRVAAIEAWRHTPCEYDRSNLLAAFQDETQDTEVRIAAYLAVMTCPTETVVLTIKDRLTSEAVNQVGSFVWTHLTNLQESAAPGKQWFRDMIGEELLQNKFNTQALKFSRNYESSFFTNELNAGAAVDSNVIFSSKSYLPRSAMLNLTLDLFGESINLFEVGGRIQGFESYIEHFFGPSGYFPQETLEGVLKNMRRTKLDAETTTLEDFLDKVTDEPEGSYYLRVFGKELHYNHFHGLDNIFHTSNPLDLIMELVRKGDIDYTKSFQLMDTHYSIPTMSGFPVTLNAKGTATLALRMNGNLNANSLTNFNIEGHLHPSAAIQMDGIMMVDAHVTRKGLKISSTLHTSTFIDGKVHINGGKLVDVAINTPKEKVEFIDVDTKFFIMEDDVLLEKAVENKIHYESCTSNIMGGQMCGELTYTPRSANSPVFPFSGPFSAKVYLQKTDTQTGYLFQYKNDPKEISLQFDTPGSQIDRKFSLAVGITQEALTFDLYTPFKAAKGTADYVWLENAKHLKLEVTLDSSEKYTLDAALNFIHDGLTKVEPTLILTAPQGQILNIHGSFGGHLAPHPILSSQLDVEYTLGGSDKHTIHHSALIKKEVNPDMTKYTFNFKLTSSQFVNMALDYDYNLTISSGHVEHHGKLSYATVTWDFEQSLNYYNEVDHKGIDFHSNVKCPAKNIDFVVSKKIELITNMMKIESHVHLSPTKDYGIQIILSKVDVGHYKAHMAGSIAAEKWEFDGELKNISILGKIRAILESSLKSPSHNIAFKGEIYGDRQKANADLKLVVNDQGYTIRAEGTQSSLMIESNIYQHMLFNAFVTASGDMQKLHVSAEWDKNVDTTKTLVIDGHISPVEVLATLKVLQREFSASGKIMPDGVEVMGQWAPDQSIVAKVYYSLDDIKSLNIIVETPFPGWEKQDATFTISATQNEINARAIANWKNSQQMTLTIGANLQAGFPVNTLSANVLFSSTFTAFERLTFSLDHKMATSTIHTNLEATWGDNKINGAINIAPTDNGIDGSVTFTSPFTEEALLTLHHDLSGNQLQTSLEAKYGTQVSTITLSGHIILDQTHDVLLDLKVLIPLESVPEMGANFKYNLDGAVLALIVDGKVDDTKIMFNVNGEKTVSEGTTSITGDLRFITPFTIPLTVTVSHSHDGQQFTSQLDMSGSLKVHADGYFISEKDILFNAYLTNPMIKSTINFNHKIENTNMKSGFEVSVNRERIGVSINGVFDPVNTLANLQMEMISTFRYLQDIKVNLDTKKEGNTWISKIIFSKGSLSTSIDHSLTFSDYLNWENILLINDVYQLRNKMIHDGTVYTFDLETKMHGDIIVQVTTSVSSKISADAHQVDAQVIIVSAWNDLFKVDLHYQDNGIEFKPTLLIEYMPGQVIELASMWRSESSSFHMESTLTTPFWQPLGYKLNISWETLKVMSLELTRGPNRTIITINGKWKTLYKMEGSMEITSTYLPQPIILEVSYDIISPKKSVFFAITKDETYSITAAISGEPKNAHWRLLTVLPNPDAQHMLIQGEYNIVAIPFTAKTKLEINSKKYEADIIFNHHDIQLNMDVEGRKGILATHWDYQDTHENIDIQFQSPVDSISDITIQAKYDVAQQKKINININEGAAEFNFVAKIADPLAPEFVLDIITPLLALKTLRVDAHWDVKNPVKSAHVSGLLNDINYTWQLEVSAKSSLKGHVVSKMTSSVPGWTSLDIETHFDFTTTPLKAIFLYNKEGIAQKYQARVTITAIDFNGEITTPIPGWENLTINGTYSYEDMHLMGKLELHQGSATYYVNSDIMFSEQPKIDLKIHTPFSCATNIAFIFEITKTETDSHLIVSFIINDMTYEADLTLQHLHKVGLVELKIQSPIPGFTSTKFVAKYDFTADVKKANLELSLEGGNLMFTANAHINDNNVLLDINTPYEGFKTIKMMGDYTVSDGQHTIMATMDANTRKYDFHFDVSAITKELSMTLTSPIDAMKLVKVYCKIDILDHGVDSSLHIQRNDDHMILKIQGNFTHLKSDFHVKLETPVAGWNIIIFDSKYDFVSENKTAEISFKKNNYYIKVINMEAQYSLERGNFKLQTPVVGFEVLGAEYFLTVDTNNHTMEATLKVIHNSNEWILTSRAQYTDNSVYFDFITPFAIIKTITVTFDYNWDASKMLSTMQITYNQYSIVFSTTLSISPTKSKFSFQASTPIPNFENISLVAKYDINNQEALVSTYINIGHQVYNFLISGYIEEKLAFFKWNLTSPFTGWTDVKFEAKIDLTQEDSIMDISLIREGNVKLIDIHGRLIGTTIDFNMKTPFENLPDFSFLGVLDRTKRSLEFNMKNELGEASVLASFHSVKLHLKTPFERAQEIVWEITKVNEGIYKAEWRRNDNFAIISVERQGRSNAFNVEIRSELQGWQLMSLAGRLNEETLESYLSGAINEEKTIFTSSATFGTVGRMNIHIETPYELFRSMDVNFDYNINEKSVMLEASSSSSNIHFKLELSPSQGIQSHLIVPNSEKDTEIAVNLGLYSGKITITSRFSAVSDFLCQYNACIESVITIDSLVQLNNNELFKLEAMANTNERKAHIDMRFHRNDGGIIIYYQRQAFSSMTFSLKRHGYTDNEFRIDVTGTSNLPAQGVLDIVINNSFLQTPATVTANIDIDTTQERKHISLQVNPTPNKLYKFDLDFGYTGESGDFDLRINIPDRKMSLWKHISGNFNINSLEDVHFEITFGEVTYTVHGKLGLSQSDLILTPGPQQENIVLQWRFLVSNNDYFIKVGRESQYSMLKLKGNFRDIAHVDMEGGFKAGLFMHDEFLFTFKWNMESNGILTSQGTFKYDQFQGHFILQEFHHNVETHTAKFVWTATSNIDGIRSLSITGNYDFDHKVVIQGIMQVESQEARVDISFTNISFECSHNTVEFIMPFLPTEFRTLQLTLSHDIRDNTRKSISAVANLSGSEHSIQALWNHSEHLADIKIKSIYVGEIHATADYNLSNIDDARVEVKYVRNISGQEAKNISLKMTRKKTTQHLESEILFDSTFHILSHARIFTNADFNEVFHLSSGLEWNDERVKFVLDINQDSIVVHLTTPFRNFESIEAKCNYSLTGKKKKVTLLYERGNNKVEMDVSLNVKSKKKGNMDLTLTTPFEILKVLHVDVKWKNNNVQVNIKKNNDEYKLNGKIDLEIENSSFDVSITILDWEIIRIAASYDVHDFLAGSSTENKKLAGLELEIEGHTVIFIVNGFRNTQNLHLDIEGSTSFSFLNTYHLELTTETIEHSHTGSFEVQLNDFEFKTTNEYEKRGENGFYIKSKVETTLTPLPALILGIGRSGEENTVTIGYGEDREITFSIQGKDNYRSGFSGFVDIPNFGYEGITYNVNYGFQDDDKLYYNVDLVLGPDGQKIEVEFLYDSEGVEARLTSPLTGNRSLRFRRSVFSEGFSAEAGFDDYNIQLRGGFKDSDFKRGALLDIDIIGYKFLFDILLQSEGMQYSEGKLIIKSPFPGMENMGGLFTLSTQNKVISGQAEIIPPFFITPVIKAQFNLDMNQKMEGHFTIDIEGEKFIFKSNLVGESIAQGYQGTFEIHTPIPLISDIVIDASIKMVQWSSVEVSLAINDMRVTTKYIMDQSNFKINLDTQIGSVHRQVSMEAKYPSLGNLKGSIIIILGEQTHDISGEMTVLENRVEGTVKLQSTLIKVQQSLAFDISIPSASFSHIIFNVSLSTSQTHSIYLELNTATNIVATVRIDTPLAPRISATLHIEPDTVSLVLDTAEQQHKVNLGWHMTHEMPADWHATAEVMSPLLPHVYTTTLLMRGDAANMMAKAELQVDSIKHIMEGKAVIGSQAGEVSLTLETPFRNINKLSLVASLSLAETVELIITATNADKVSTIHVTYDKANMKFMVMVRSPFIPRGQARLETTLTGNMAPNMKLKMTLKYGSQIMTSVLNLKMADSNNMMAVLKMTTPFRGYKKMNFMASYKKEQLTTILITINRPIRLNLELHLNNTTEKILADMKLVTSLEGLESAEAEMEMPLDVFAPSVTVEMMRAGVPYGGHLVVRTKAPSELGWGYHVGHHISGGFHLKTDSSFFSFLA